LIIILYTIHGILNVSTTREPEPSPHTKKPRLLPVAEASRIMSPQRLIRSHKTYTQYTIGPNACQVFWQAQIYWDRNRQVPGVFEANFRVSKN